MPHTRSLTRHRASSLKSKHITFHYRIALIGKRAGDMVGSALLLLAFFPAMAVIALCIKCDSRGPVLFSQERVGWRGRRFRMLKFRTMVFDAEARLSDLMDRNEAAGPYFKIRRDPRITRTGAFLRRWSLDELPQLLNVFRGEMSLVGPRPLLPQTGRLEDWYGLRLEVRPGMTGLWQIRGRSDLPLGQAVALDLSYIDNWSLGLDLRILTATLPAVLRGKGAY